MDRGHFPTAWIWWLLPALAAPETVASSSIWMTSTSHKNSVATWLSGQRQLCWECDLNSAQLRWRRVVRTSWRPWARKSVAISKSHSPFPRRVKAWTSRTEKSKPFCWTPGELNSSSFQEEFHYLIDLSSIDTCLIFFVVICFYRLDKRTPCDLSLLFLASEIENNVIQIF